MNAPAFPITNLPNRTPADYVADMVRRFGYLPSLAALARLESREMRARAGNYRMTDAATVRAEFEANPARMAMLAAMTEPMTQREIAAKTGMHKSSVQQAVDRGVRAGLIRKHSMNEQHVSIWERATA
jgi:hypothetical protein